jgi:flagellar basal body rod protein FlgF
MDDKLNKLYTDFVGKDVLDGITSDNFDELKNLAFITPENKEYFEDMLRIGQLSNQLSASGPIPGSMTTRLMEITSPTTTDAFIPDIGESWIMIAADKGGEYTGETNCVLRVEAPDENGVSRAIEIAQQTGTNAPFTFANGAPVVVAYPGKISILTQGSASSGTTTVRIALVRER